MSRPCCITFCGKHEREETQTPLCNRHLEVKRHHSCGSGMGSQRCKSQDGRLKDAEAGRHTRHACASSYSAPPETTPSCLPLTISILHFLHEAADMKMYHVYYQVSVHPTNPLSQRHGGLEILALASSQTCLSDALLRIQKPNQSPIKAIQPQSHRNARTEHSKLYIGPAVLPRAFGGRCMTTATEKP